MNDEEKTVTKPAKRSPILRVFGLRQPLPGPGREHVGLRRSSARSRSWCSRRSDAGCRGSTPVNRARRRRAPRAPSRSLGLGVFFLQQVLNAAAHHASTTCSSRSVIFDLRSDLYSHIQRLPLNWFDNRATGDLMTRILEDVTSRGARAHRRDRTGRHRRAPDRRRPRDAVCSTARR